MMQKPEKEFYFIGNGKFLNPVKLLLSLDQASNFAPPRVNE